MIRVSETSAEGHKGGRPSCIGSALLVCGGRGGRGRLRAAGSVVEALAGCRAACCGCAVCGALSLLRGAPRGRPRALVRRACASAARGRGAVDGGGGASDASGRHVRTGHHGFEAGAGSPGAERGITSVHVEHPAGLARRSARVGKLAAPARLDGSRVGPAPRYQQPCSAGRRCGKPGRPERVWHCG